MNKSIQRHIYSLLSLMFFATYCCGQITRNLLEDSVNKSKTMMDGQPKMIKTQGSNEYQNVHCAIIDKAGNLWFGTTGEGVYRYDGKLFIQFTKKDGLFSNTVWSILEDKAGDIWIGTEGGLCKYDGKIISHIPLSATNFMYPDSNDNNPSSKNEIWSILQDKTGKLWFGTSDGVYCYNGKSFTHFLENDGVINKENLHLKMVDCILEDKNGNIWFGSGMPPGMEGICLYDGKSIVSFKPGGDLWIRYLIEDKNGIIWSGGRHEGTWCYNGTTFIKFPQKKGIGLPVLNDKAGNIWFNGEEKSNSIESRDGIWRYDGNTFTNFSTREGLENYFAFCIIQDKAGAIWVGTRNNGLYKYDGKIFTTFSE